MINQVGSAFNECSAEIKRIILSTPVIHEKTITEWLLTNLPKKTQRIKYQQFAPSSENGDTLADWEWWFVISDQTSFAARIQAMKLDSSANNDPVMFSNVDEKSPIEEWIERNTNDGYASMFVLYTTNDNNSSICKNGKTNDGVFWSEANKFRNEFLMNDKRNLSSAEIISICNPVSCSLCCPGIYGEGMDIGQGFRQHIGHYFPRIAENGNTAFRDTPQDVLDLLENESVSNRRDSTRKSKGILVVDLRRG